MNRTVCTLVCVLAISAVAQADMDDPNAYATEVVSYTPGTGITIDWISGLPFDDPNTALGRPTIDTTGDGWYIPLLNPVPVVIAAPAFRSFELTSVGTGGELVLKFNRPVTDDPSNPYGVDLIVFGNAFRQVGGGQGWTNGDPDLVTPNGPIVVEPGLVSVAQDPNGPWYTFADGPYADEFPPTLGRLIVDDPNDADPNLGTWNDWWGGPTDPTRPLDPNDPNMTASGLSGKTVGEVARLYNGSAGGTGFDIGSLGLAWIQYVRIQDDPATNSSTEIDAVADVAPGVVLELTLLNEDYGEVDISPNPVADPPTTFFPNEVVGLVATPIEGKAFSKWVIYDPNFPGDANYATEDTNTVTTINMMCDREVEAVFKCGSGTGGLLPLGVVGLSLWGMAIGRRRQS